MIKEITVTSYPHLCLKSQQIPLLMQKMDTQCISPIAQMLQSTTKEIILFLELKVTSQELSKQIILNKKAT